MVVYHYRKLGVGGVIGCLPGPEYAQPCVVFRIEWHVSGEYGIVGVSGIWCGGDSWGRKVAGDRAVRITDELEVLEWVNSARLWGFVIGHVWMGCFDGREMALVVGGFG